MHEANAESTWARGPLLKTTSKAKLKLLFCGSDTVTALWCKHKHEQQSLEQRQQRDVAKMRQDIFDEFMSLLPDEQSKTLTKAKQAQDTFLQQVMNTPPGAERVLLMKSIDLETQKLLIIHKTCAGSRE